MSVKQVLLGFVVVGCVCGANAGSVLYQNDFSRRTSVVKPGPWRELNYVTGARLAYSYATTRYMYTDDLPWAEPTVSQDGWIQGGPGADNSDGAGGWFPGSYVLTNLAEECPGDTARPFGAFVFDAMTHTWCRLLQPIGNSFTNGVVRYTVDMRPPKWWGAKHYGSWAPIFRFYPAFRRDLRCPEIGSASEEYPCSIGFTRTGQTASLDNVLVQGANRNIRHGGTPLEGGEVTPGAWYRCHVEIDIDSETCLMSMDELGTTVPEWTTEPVEADVLKMASAVAWKDRMTSERGPIAGLAFQVEGVNSLGSVTNMPSFTNIRVEWKAPGASAFECCYENDFVTRRMRTLQAVTEAFDYPAIAERTEENAALAYGYDGVWGTNELPSANSSYLVVQKPLYGGASPEPVGFDGWRRIYSQGWGMPTIANYDGDNKFRVTWPYSDANGVFGCFAQPLGETITSGKVRLLVDVRTPDKFWFTSNSGLYVSLGDSRHYASCGNGSLDTCVSIAGIGCGDATLCYPEWKTNGTWPNGKDSFACEQTHWYRIETIADLDAKTFDYNLYDLDGATPETPVFGQAGLAFAASGVRAEVAALSLCAYGPGRDEAGAMLFDNVTVWKNWDAAEETGERIYFNDFTVRRRPSVRVSENLGDAPNLMADEKDRWTIRGGEASRVKRVLGANDNPCVAMSEISSKAFALQDFGEVFTRGVLAFTADLRPPTVWNRGDDGREASVYLGGAKMAQGDLQGDKDAIWKSAAALFGFDGGGAPWDAANVSHEVRAYAMSGNATERFEFTVVPAHWYRFRAKLNPKTRTYSVNAYDMGADHPDLDAPDGTLVGTLKNLAFVDASVDDLSTVCLRAVGVRAEEPWRAEDGGMAFFDNLKAECRGDGCLIVVR